MDALGRLLRGAEEVTHRVASFLSAPAVVDRAGCKLLGDEEVQCCLQSHCQPCPSLSKISTQKEHALPVSSQSFCMRGVCVFTTSTVLLSNITRQDQDLQIILIYLVIVPERWNPGLCSWWVSKCSTTYPAPHVIVLCYKFNFSLHQGWRSKEQLFYPIKHRVKPGPH